MTHSAHNGKKKGQRWLALDLFRFVAVLLMVQGHVFHEVLSDELRAEYWHRWHGYVHGFTAPLFLFAAGTAFGITTLRRWDEHTTWGPPLAKRIERYLVLIGIGYFLQFGQLSLIWIAALPLDQLHIATRIDALQHIGLVLLGVELLVWSAKNRTVVFSTITAAMLAAVFSAPWVWNIDVSAWPVPVAAWVNADTSSIFPIVPWAGFLLAGLLMARVVHALGPQRLTLFRFALPLFALGFAGWYAGRFLHWRIEPGFFPEHNHWKTSPWFFLERLGMVFMVLGSLQFFELGLRAKKAALTDSFRWVRSIQIIGQQTLVIFVGHILMLYGHFGIPGLRQPFHRRLDLFDASALVFLFYVAMTALAFGWHRAKQQNPSAFDRVRYGVLGLAALRFLLV